MPPAPAPTPAPQPAITPAVIRFGMAHRRLAGVLLARAGLHPGQERLLFALDGGAQPVGALASRLGVNAPTMTKMVARLERGGLVRTAADVADGRIRLVRLTARGRQAARAAASVWAELGAATVARLDADERAELVRLLTRCAEGVEAALEDQEGQDGASGCPDTA